MGCANISFSINLTYAVQGDDTKMRPVRRAEYLRRKVLEAQRPGKY
jgi:hypothetical protein